MTHRELKTCVIIAAGQGTRLRKRGKCKPLIPLLGVPLIERIIRNASQSGINDFVIIVGYEADKLTAFLIKLADKLKISIKISLGICIIFLVIKKLFF